MPSYISPPASMDDSSRRCTAVAQRHCGEIGAFCDAPVPPGAPVTMCGAHLMAAYSYCTDLLAAVDHGHAESEPEPVKVSPYARHEPIVYYARIAGLIKIGTTTNIAARMNGLGADEFIAYEPGSYHLETLRHQAFAEHRATGGSREYFTESPALNAHMAELAARHGSPSDLMSRAYPRSVAVPRAGFTLDSTGRMLAG